MVCLLWNYGFLEMFLVFQMDQVNLRVMFTNITSLIRKSMWMKDIDIVLSNVQSSRQEGLLYVFGDSEAVIKMIIKGRSPTMRHVSRTHRVALDWLSDRINLDSKIRFNLLTPRTNFQTS